MNHEPLLDRAAVTAATPSERRAGEAGALWAAFNDHLVSDLHRSAATVRPYRRVLVAFWTFAGKEPERVRNSDLRRFLAHSALPSAQATDPGLADTSSRAKAMAILRCYEWAARTQRLPKNPLATFVPPVGAPAKPVTVDSSALASLLELVAGSPRLRTMTWLAYGAGLRVGEIARLRVEDCRFGSPTTVRTRSHGGGVTRVVTLHPTVAVVLAVYLARAPERGPVFPSAGRPGWATAPETVSRLLCTALKDAGLPARPHEVRHALGAELRRGHRGSLGAPSALLGLPAGESRAPAST